MTSATGAGQSVAISGQVKAPDPGGVTVTVQQATLVGASMAGAVTLSADSGPVGKFLGSPGSTSSGQLLGPPVATTTYSSGFFAFSAQFASPDEYLITFAKAGYGTQKYVVTAAGAPIQLAVTMVPGQGSLSGKVTGPHGPVGGAIITVTDGTVTATASSPSVGPLAGTWSISGLTTPDSLLVTASAPGYGSATTLVKLRPGQSASRVDLVLVPGVASIVGTVRGGDQALGGITVTATDGTVTKSVSTLTATEGSSSGLAGTYVIPDLPMPAQYSVTASGGSWAPADEPVALSGPNVQRSGHAVVNFDLFSTAAKVSGMVRSGGRPLGGVGVVMTDGKNTYKTLTATPASAASSLAPAGSYNFDNVAAGHYVLIFSLFGYAARTLEADVPAGQSLVMKPLDMPEVSKSSEDRAQITGNVVDLASGNPVTAGSAEVDGNPALVAKLGTNGSYVVGGLTAGVHTVTIDAAGYEPYTVTVDVPMDATAVAPLALLPPLDALMGVIISNAGGVVGGAFVNITPTPSTEQCGNPSDPSAAPSALVVGPDGKTKGCFADANGDYRLVGLPHGNYTVAVQSPDAPGTPNPFAVCGTGQVAPCGYFDAYAPASGTVTLAEGQSQVRNLNMDMYGRLQVSAVTPAQAGSMQEVGVPVTITGPFGCGGSALAQTSAGPTTAPCVTTTSVQTFATSSSSTVATPATASGSPPAVSCPTNGAVTEHLSTGGTSSPGNPVEFQGLPPGQYEVCFGDGLNADDQVVTTSPDPALVKVANNASGTYSTVMLVSSLQISGSLVFMSGGGDQPVTCTPPIGAPTCSPGTVTATWDYYDTNISPPTLLSGNFTTNIAQNGTFVFDNVPQGEQIASPTLSLQISAGGFQALTENNVSVPSCTSSTTASSTSSSASTASSSTSTTTTTGSSTSSSTSSTSSTSTSSTTTTTTSLAGCRPGYFANIVLNPFASKVSATVVLHNGRSTTDTSSSALSAVSVSILSSTGAGTGITGSVDSNGQLVWNDPNSSVADAAIPGSYELQFSASGYDSVTVPSVVVPINTSCTAQPCAPVEVGNVDMYEHATVTFDAVNTSGTAMDGASFVVYDPAGTPATELAAQTAGSGASSVTFSGLSLHGQSSYNLEVEAYTGCTGALDSSVTIYPGTNAAVPVTLAPVACIDGTVDGVLQNLRNVGSAPSSSGNQISPLEGMTVTAACAAGGSSTTYSAVTGGDGSFVILGSASASGLGLVPAGSSVATCQVQVSSRSGYGSASFWDTALVTAESSTVVLATGASQTLGVALYEQDISVSGTILDTTASPHLPIPGVTISISGANSSAPAVPGACSGGGAPVQSPAQTITTDSTGAYSLCLTPGSWSVTFSENNYATVTESFTLSAGDGAMTLSPGLTESFNEITGTVYGLMGQNSQSALDLTSGTVTVTDIGPSACGGAPPCSVAMSGLDIIANSNGTFTITGKANRQLIEPNENYTVAFSVPGYQSYSQNVEITQAAGYDYALGPVLNAYTATVAVPVVDASTGKPIVGATVTLSAVGSTNCTLGAGSPYCTSGISQGATTTGADGTATFYSVAAGEYKIVATGYGIGYNSATTSVCMVLQGSSPGSCTSLTSEGQTVTASQLQLSQATEMVITAELQDDAPSSGGTSSWSVANGASVDVYSGASASGTPVATGTTDSTGTYLTSGTAGQYTVSVSDAGYETENFTFTVTTGEIVAPAVQIQLPVTSWQVAVSGTSAYTSTAYTLNVDFSCSGTSASCAAADPSVTGPVAGTLGSSGGYYADANESPALPLVANEKYSAQACEVYTATIPSGITVPQACSSSASATIGPTGAPVPSGTTLSGFPTVTGTSLAAVPSPGTEGQQVVYTATVSPVSGSLVRGTVVEFFDATSAGGTATAISGCTSVSVAVTGPNKDTASCDQTYGSPGSHYVVALFTDPSGTFAASLSDTSFVEVINTTTTTTTTVPTTTTSTTTTTAPTTTTSATTTTTTTTTPSTSTTTSTTAPPATTTTAAPTTTTTAPTTTTTASGTTTT
ncbi:MAG TPA: carboxypeptidase regulatory-like domain-containing protein [Acidimicrobiales bacterium]|nr:carboxypeptidase regulatory-like domain-containing protein [Acidimicrobiales bacterium]